MMRITREISSRLYIFLPYLSFNLGELPDTLEDTLWVVWEIGKLALVVYKTMITLSNTEE